MGQWGPLYIQIEAEKGDSEREASWSRVSNYDVHACPVVFLVVHRTSYC